MRLTNFLEHIFRSYMMAFCYGCILFRQKFASLASGPGNLHLDNRKNKCINMQLHIHTCWNLPPNLFSWRQRTRLQKDFLHFYLQHSRPAFRVNTPQIIRDCHYSPYSKAVSTLVTWPLPPQQLLSPENCKNSNTRLF